MTTTYNFQPDTVLHPLDDAIVELEFAEDSRTTALARLAIQKIWAESVTADDFNGTTQVIYRAEE